MWQPGEKEEELELLVLLLQEGLQVMGALGWMDTSSSGKTGKEGKTGGSLHGGAASTLVVASLLIESMCQDQKKNTE